MRDEFEKPLHCTNKATGESYTLFPVSTEAVRETLKKIKEQVEEGSHYSDDFRDPDYYNQMIPSIVSPPTEEEIATEWAYANRISLTAGQFETLEALLATVRAEGRAEIEDNRDSDWCESLGLEREGGVTRSRMREIGRDLKAEGRLAVYREPEDAGLSNAYSTGKARGAREEREAVVRHLRSSNDVHHTWFDASVIIERGDHLKGDR